MPAEDSEIKAESALPTLPFARWWLVAAAALAMGVAGTYQFVWSAIRGPLGTAIGASEATLGTLFTVLLTVQTLAQFPAGWVRDRRGPRLPLLAGTALLVGGYAGLARAGTPATAAVAVAVGGAGSGAVYTVAVNTPVKWFDDRRGLATGIVTMAYSGLSVVFIPVLRGGLVGSFTRTLLVFAGVGGAACLVGVLVLRDPDGAATDESAPEDDESKAPGEQPAYSWRETIRTWQFWVLYGVFVVINGVGLMLVGKVIAFADALELSAATATAAAATVAVADGAGVVTGGGISDRLDPARTVGGALLVSAVGIVGAVLGGTRGLETGFVLLVGAAAFFRSPAFAVFPSLVGSYYGTARSSENYAVLYTGKLWGSVLGGAATSLLITAIGWERAFLLGAGLLLLAGVVMFGVRPVESAHPDR